jgi:zinc D-Ala-D-Ala carboxypeptidase
VLRRKRDGRYLAAVLPEGVTTLAPHALGETGIDAALHAVEANRERSRHGASRVATLPLDRLEERLDAIGLNAQAYGEHSGFALVPEPAWLAFAGFDRFRRPLWLHAAAERGWKRMFEAALRDGVVLEAISGYRSHDYQLGIFARKRARGLSVEEILAVNAAPGYSEHHSGLALDIGTPGEPPAEESFEDTPAFAWLREHAGGHGFEMSYPRGNPHGIVYEPWHWRYAAP